MIPKVIHYCWFGGKPIPDEYKKYMASWKQLCPDFEIIEWNEKNFDVSENEYCHEAYKSKKWAFVSDYARLKILYEQGGVYLDTDVELLKPLFPMISKGIGFLGFQNEEEVNTGLGFAAPPHNSCVKEMMNLYRERHFLKEKGKFDLSPCPVANTVALKQCGLKTGRKFCREIQYLDGLDVYPITYFNPINPDNMRLVISQETVSIHHYAASWTGKKRRMLRNVKKYFGGGHCTTGLCIYQGAIFGNSKKIIPDILGYCFYVLLYISDNWFTTFCYIKGRFLCRQFGCNKYQLSGGAEL